MDRSMFKTVHLERSELAMLLYALETAKEPNDGAHDEMWALHSRLQDAMNAEAHEQSSGEWHEGLVCFLVSCLPLNDETVVLNLADGSVPNMRGAIALGQAVLPGVRSIFVTSGGEPCMSYSYDGLDWEALSLVRTKNPRP